MKNKLLEYSYKNKLSHIPSALSMLDYVDVLFSNGYVVPGRDKIVIGKPFGAQAYYLVWEKLQFITDIEKLSVGVKHDEIPFVDYGEETMGNALGVAIGIALACPTTQVWVNITDATLQMGNALEALQFIGHNRIKNIFVTVDYNNAQVTGATKDVLNVGPIIALCKSYNWWTQEVNGHSHSDLRRVFDNLTDNLPNIVFCHTEKGHGVKAMAADLKKWHYKTITTQQELKELTHEEV